MCDIDKRSSLFCLSVIEIWEKKVFQRRQQDKIVMTLLNKSGDTNKFLREDCNVALDHIIENVSFIKSVAVVTQPEVVGHKNPVVRATVSRLLAYVVDRMGIGKALSGNKDVVKML